MSLLSDDVYHCHFCGLTHKLVEAGGMYHCVNLLCPGPGASWFRVKLKSYKEVENGRHTVGIKEWKAAAVSYLQDNPDQVSLGYVVEEM